MKILWGKEMLYTGLYDAQYEDGHLRKDKELLVLNPQPLTHRKNIPHLEESSY